MHNAEWKLWKVFTFLLHFDQRRLDLLQFPRVISHAKNKDKYFNIKLLTATMPLSYLEKHECPHFAD
jgi:hypothetical protein